MPPSFSSKSTSSSAFSSARSIACERRGGRRFEFASHPWSSMLILCVSSPASLLLALAAACGQKGPLYLRESPPPGVKPAKPKPYEPVPYPPRHARRREVGRALYLPQRRAVRRRSAAGRNRAALRHAVLRLLRRRHRGRLPRVRAGAEGPRRADLLFGQGEFQPRDPRAARAPRRRLRHRFRRRAGARARRGRRCAQDAVLRRRQERGRDPLRAGKGHRLHQRRVRGRARARRRGGAQPRPARADRLARQPGHRRQDTSLHLHRPA